MLSIGHILLGASIFDISSAVLLRCPWRCTCFLTECIISENKKYHLSIYESLLSLLFTFPSLYVSSTYIILNYSWPYMRQPSWNSGSVTIVIIIPLVPFGWNEVPRIQGILKLFSFLQTAVIVLENYPKAAPLSWPYFSFLSNMLFSPILPLWFNRGNISWFQEALLFSDPKKCSRKVGVFLIL